VFFFAALGENERPSNLLPVYGLKVAGYICPVCPQIAEKSGAHLYKTNNLKNEQL
jgi:hypothetical protein